MHDTMNKRKPIHQRWAESPLTFAPDPDAHPMTADELGQVNRARAAMGLKPVAADSKGDTMDDQDFKVRENKARRAAKRQGLELEKSRRRDPRSLGFGGYRLVNAGTGRVVAGELDSRRALSIDQVETFLNGGEV